MKRIAITISIVVIFVATFAVPAFASIGTTYHPIEFTELDMGVGYGTNVSYFQSKVPFTLNSLVGKDPYAFMDYEEAYWTANAQDMYNNALRTDILISIFGSSSGFTFRFRNPSVVIYTSALTSSTMYVSMPQVIPDDSFTVAVTGTFVNLVSDGDEYVRSTVPFAISSSSTSSGIDIISMIYSKLPQAMRTQQFTFIENLVVQVSTAWDYDEETVVRFQSTGGTINTMSSVGNWLNQYDLPVTNVTVEAPDGSDADWLGWISRSLNSFFDTELFGTVSFNDIFGFCIVFGLLFWFLKLTV